MAFFSNAQDSIIILQGQLHELHKNPMKSYPRFIYGETQTIEDYMLRFPNKFARERGFNKKMWFSVCSPTPWERRHLTICEFIIRIHHKIGIV